MMEEVLLRFPHIGYQIFKQLNNPFLTNCREVSNSWKNFIDNEKLPWIRMIIQKIKPLTSPWKKFLQKSNKTSLVQMATSVVQHFKNFDFYQESTGPINTVPLHFAAMTGNTEMIERLIQNGAELNEIDSFQCTPLHYAARNDHLTAYQLIMKNNPIKNPEIGYMTPFHVAAKHGHFLICKLIIDNIKDKNPKNVDDETPLHYAAKGGFLDICLLIIDNKRTDLNPGDESGNTPLHYAATSGNLVIFKLIISNIQHKNPPANDGITPLHLAAKYDKLAIFQWIFHNVNLFGVKNPRDNYGYTPLHYAAEGGYLAICQLIITNVEDKNPGLRPSGGLTPLHLAARKRHYNICQLFMENIQELRTPLHQGYRNWHDEVCNMMMQYSGKTTKRNADEVSRKHRVSKFYGKFHFPRN